MKSQLIAGATTPLFLFGIVPGILALASVAPGFVIWLT